jgi:hypothetical protein
MLLDECIIAKSLVERKISTEMPASVQVSKTELDWLVDMSHGRLSGLIVVCFGRFWTRDVPFANARYLGT